jgi:hypothetical protein
MCACVRMWVSMHVCICDRCIHTSTILPGTVPRAARCIPIILPYLTKSRDTVLSTKCTYRSTQVHSSVGNYCMSIGSVHMLANKISVYCAQLYNVHALWHDHDQKLQQQNQHRSTCMKQHACTMNCTFIGSSTFMVCQSSGNLHICTATICDRLRIGAYNRVCMLSGKTYQLSLSTDREKTAENFSIFVTDDLTISNGQLTSLSIGFNDARELDTLCQCNDKDGKETSHTKPNTSGSVPCIHKGDAYGIDILHTMLARMQSTHGSANNYMPMASSSTSISSPVSMLPTICDREHRMMNRSTSLSPHSTSRLCATTSPSTKYKSENYHEKHKRRRSVSEGVTTRHRRINVRRRLAVCCDAYTQVVTENTLVQDGSNQLHAQRPALRTDASCLDVANGSSCTNIDHDGSVLHIVQTDVHHAHEVAGRIDVPAYSWKSILNSPSLTTRCVDDHVTTKDSIVCSRVRVGPRQDVRDMESPPLHTKDNTVESVSDTGTANMEVTRAKHSLQVLRAERIAVYQKKHRMQRSIPSHQVVPERKPHSHSDTFKRTNGTSRATQRWNRRGRNKLCLPVAVEVNNCKLSLNVPNTMMLCESARQTLYGLTLIRFKGDAHHATDIVSRMDLQVNMCVKVWQDIAEFCVEMDEYHRGILFEDICVVLLYEMVTGKAITIFAENDIHQTTRIELLPATPALCSILPPWDELCKVRAWKKSAHKDTRRSLGLFLYKCMCARDERLAFVCRI